MTLTPSKQFINNSTVQFTPAGGSAVNILNVKTVTFNPGVENVKDSGDAQFYNTLNVAVSADPTVTIETTKPALLNAVVFGQVGVLTWTENDAVNGAAAGGGGIIYTVSNCIFLPQARNSRHRAVGDTTHVFGTFSADGSTSMIASAAA